MLFIPRRRRKALRLQPFKLRMANSLIQTPSEKLKAIALLLGAIAFSLFLFWFKPGESMAAVPLCYFYAFTGFHCPGCGITRATHELLNGHFTNALFLNPFVFFAVILIGYGVLYYVLPRLSLYRLPRLQLSKTTVFTFSIILILFGVLRNLPIYPFNLFAPQFVVTTDYPCN
jgi:hypothetical protein